MRVRGSIRYSERVSPLRNRIDIRNHSSNQQEQRAASPGTCVYRTIAPGN
jgi:hypothetical protein